LAGKKKAQKQGGKRRTNDKCYLTGASEVKMAMVNVKKKKK
jgi:hypothetical protein